MFKKTFVTATLPTSQVLLLWEHVAIMSTCS